MEERDIKEQIESIVGVQIDKANKTDKETVEDILQIKLEDK